MIMIYGVKLYRKQEKPIYISNVFGNGIKYRNFTYNINEAFRVRERWAMNYEMCEYEVEEYK